MQITIINPINDKGVIDGRKYLANKDERDEANYIELGAVLRTDNGTICKSETIKVEATESDQNKEIEGTGNLTTIVENEAKKKVYYYPFRYRITKPGAHKITFTEPGSGASAEVSFTAENDERPLPKPAEEEDEKKEKEPKDDKEPKQ